MSQRILLHEGAIRFADLRQSFSRVLHVFRHVAEPVLSYELLLELGEVVIFLSERVKVILPVNLDRQFKSLNIVVNSEQAI